MGGSLHTWKVYLSHTTHRLIIIRVGRNYKGNKALPHNTIVFLKLEVETTG